ncbi:MAG: DUF4332 domain-containing protein [Fuerstiella sp.]|nr:DUF4332 domain-containing protein [Fuerstiella sp.]
MRFLDFSVKQFGVLKNLQLQELSPGLTVVYGGSGTGKTTLVHLLRGLLFGYTTEHQAFQAEDGRYGGSVSLESRGRFLRMSRERSHGVSTELSAVDLTTGIPVTVCNGDLPAWVNENTFREVFSVGEQEAVRFDLLCRLCLDDAGVATEDEIRRAEDAIMLSVQEREGAGLNNGLRHRITVLQRLREELVAELATMRRVSPEIPQQIARLEAELQRSRESAEPLNLRIQEVSSDVARLEMLHSRLTQQNSVALTVRPIEERISDLVERRQRWSGIQDAVQREISLLTSEAAAPLQCQESLVSVRAIVSRLEERMATADFGANSTGIDRESVPDDIRSEVFALCDYVARHASSVASHLTALESVPGRRMLQDIQHVDTVVKGQIDALKEELERSADVLSITGKYGSACDSAVHAACRKAESIEADGRSIVEVESALARQRQALEDLEGEQSRVADGIRGHEDRLTELQVALRSSGRLQDLDRIKGKIAETDARLCLLNDRRRVLETTEANLQTVIERLGQFLDHNVLEIASEYIDRLTDGECYRLAADSTGTTILAAIQQSPDLQVLQKLSRGTRDLVALALRLALIQHRAEDSERVPLIIDDVFILTDDARSSAAADLLTEVAADGQQIIFFTCQREVRDLFEQRNACLRHLGPQDTAKPSVVPEPPVATCVPPQPTVMATAKTTETTKPTETTNWLFYLEVDSSIEDLSGLTVAELEAIRASGIINIDELMTLSVEVQRDRFREGGYSISTDRIRAWRGQAELATLVPMLRRSDADLLYAAGIQGAVELSRMRPETVYEVVAVFQKTQSGTRYCRSGRTLDRQQAISWSRWSQHSRTLTEARNARSRFFVHSRGAGEGQASEPVSGGTAGPGRRQNSAGGQSTIRRLKRPGLSDDDCRLREQRHRNRRQRMARHSASYRTSQGKSHNDNAGAAALKFYLNRSADVDAAPSIGPRTAERLATVEVFTVDDLLNANADSIARRLANRRVSGETIMQWQCQARLVCTVPGLREHDSQILVACGINDAEQLAQKRPADLFALVRPFSETSEGERIIRGGTRPDLEEISDWVSWAQQSRTLKAAA